MRYRLAGDTETMTAAELIEVAALAYAGGLLEVMPTNADEAVDAFQAIDIDVEEADEGLHQKPDVQLSGHGEGDAAGCADNVRKSDAGATAEPLRRRAFNADRKLKIVRKK